MAVIFPRTGVFDAYDITGRNSDSGAWRPSQHEAAADRCTIVPSGSPNVPAGHASIPAMPSAWNTSRAYYGRSYTLKSDADVLGHPQRAQWLCSTTDLGENIGEDWNFGEERWIATEIYFHPTLSNFRVNTDWNIPFTIHHPGSTGTAPIGLMINTNPGTDPSTHFFRVKYGSGTGNVGSTSKEDFASYTTGWHRFLFRVIPQNNDFAGPTGLVEVWMDDWTGSPLVHHEGVNHFDGEPNVGYIKTGISMNRLVNSDFCYLWHAGFRVSTTVGDIITNQDPGNEPPVPDPDPPPPSPINIAAWTTAVDVDARTFVPPVQVGSYTINNLVTDRTFDADSTSVAELADVLGTIITDVVNDTSFTPWTVTNQTLDRDFDASSTTVAELADILGQIVADYKAGQSITGYTVGTYTETRTYDADSTSIGELADVTATLISDIQVVGSGAPKNIGSWTTAVDVIAEIPEVSLPISLSPNTVESIALISKVVDTGLTLTAESSSITLTLTGA